MTGSEGEERLRRAALNEALCRDVNERIEDVQERVYGVSTDLFNDFICECSSMSCAERVALTVAEYERLRSDAEAFVVVPSPRHVFPELEDVVEQEERFWVVRKRGAGAEVARELDPRARNGA